MSRKGNLRNLNRTRHTVNNSFWGIFYRMLHIVFPILLRAIIIRTIGPAFVGVGGLFKSVFSVLNLSELGLGSAIVYMMYKPVAEGDKVTIRRMLTLLRNAYRVIGGVMLVVGLALIPFLKMLVRNDLSVEVNIYLLYAMYLFHNVMSYWMFAFKNSIFTAHQMTEVNFRIYSIIAILQYSIQIVVLFVVKNYYWYLLVYAVLIIPQNLMFHFSAKRRFPDLYPEGKPTKEEISLLFKKIRALIGHRLGNTFLYSIDSLIISAILGVSFNVKYDSYNYILTSLAALLTVLRTSSMASVGNKIVLDSRESTYRLMSRLSFMWVGLVGFMIGCLSALYQPFIALWMGSKYTYPDALMLCFCIYFFVWQFRAMHMVVKDAAGLWEADFAKPYIGMALNFGLSALCVWLIKQYVGAQFGADSDYMQFGIIGAQIPTMAILLGLYFPWEVRVLFKKFFMRSAREYVLKMVRYSLTAIAGAAAVYLVSRFLPDRGLIALIVRVPVCLLMPAAYLLLNANTRELRESVPLVTGTAKKLLRKIRKTPKKTN